MMSPFESQETCEEAPFEIVNPSFVVNKTRAVHEGIYPESEQIFIYHQLIDIVNPILRFGRLCELALMVKFVRIILIWYCYLYFSVFFSEFIRFSPT
jgi:hypothetical protein